MIQKLSNQAALLFKECTEAYLQNDAIRAAALGDMDSYLDDLHRQFIQMIFESHATGNIDLQVAVQLAVVARFYERIGDHAVNVGERTRYIVSGWIPEHKHDESHNEIPEVVTPPADGG
jgi:phosphate transport system protein